MTIGILKGNKCERKPNGQPRMDNKGHRQCWTQDTHKMTERERERERERAKRTMSIKKSDPGEGRFQVIAKGNLFLLLGRHPPCYSYIQSSRVDQL
jgi:hypothetical protein